MRDRQSILPAVAVIAMSLVQGCGPSLQEHAQMRRAELLKLYPAGATRRAEVQAKWSPVLPDLSETRPDKGWVDASQDLKTYVLASEKRTGKPVYRCERYWGIDPSTFLGLEYNWYFYDEADILTDIEWQYHTD